MIRVQLISVHESSVSEVCNTYFRLIYSPNSKMLARLFEHILEMVWRRSVSSLSPAKCSLWHTLNDS